MFVSRSNAVPVKLLDARIRMRRAPRSPLCANDVETSDPREFTLEGRGQSIKWLCPFTVTIRLLPAALKQKEAVGRPCVPGMGTGLEVKVLRGARW